MSTNEKRKISHKVGVKILSDIQLENVLPTYNNLLRKIEVCRDVARNELEDATRQYQDNFMYDNVFSILGDRGTGKTSVAFTLQNMIQKRDMQKHNGDVVLPLIIPEAIPENCTILGWLLAIVKEEVEKLEKQIHNLEEDKTEDMFWNRCKNSGESLSDRLERMNQLFHAGSYNPANEASYYKAVDNSVAQSEDYYHFAKGIAQLWDEWVERIRDLQRLEKSDEDVCPMIYFIFDDVDLAPDKIEQLLSVIIKYLSHPNIIVITTADEEMFLKVIEKQLENNIGRVPRERINYFYDIDDIYTSEEKEYKEMIKKTARMYLGKVLPTSTRYYLRTFHTAKQKELFSLEDTCNLGESIHQQVGKLLKKVGNDTVDFMMYEGELINFYLKYIGITSRQIGNAYIALQEYIDSMIDIVSNEKKISNGNLISRVYQNCRYFIRVAINANHEMAEAVQEIDELLDEVLLPEYNQWKVYIHYAHLNEILKGRMETDSDEKKIEIGMQLFSLFAFVENILFVMENGISGGITNRQKIYVVSFLAEYIEDIAFNKKHLLQKKLDANVFFGHYSNLFDRMSIITKSQISDMTFNMEYFYNFRYYHFDDTTKEKNKVELIFEEDPQWFRELSGMLSMVYGNAYLFDSNNMAECLPFLAYQYLPMYAQWIEQKMRSNIIKCFEEPEMHLVWGKKKDKYSSIFKKIINGIGKKESIPEASISLATAVKTGIMKDNEIEKKQSYTRLSDIVEQVLLKVENNGEIEQAIQKGWIYFPDDIIQDIKESSFLDNVAATRELLLKYQQIISMSPLQLFKNGAKSGLLEDRDYFISQLDRLRRICPIHKRNIFDIRNKLNTEWKNKRKDGTYPMELISFQLFMDIFQEINLLGSREIVKGVFQEEADEMNDILAELASEMDIAINIREQSEVQAGVDLAMRVVFYELLQTIYIYQIIYMRYESNNSLSSKELESVKDGQETYYYTMYKEILAVTKKKNKAAIKSVINSVHLEERQRYINRLIAEVKDEQV